MKETVLRAGLKFASKYSPSYDFEILRIVDSLVTIRRTSSENHSWEYPESIPMVKDNFKTGIYFEIINNPNDITTS